MISITALVLVISIGFLMPKAAGGWHTFALPRLRLPHPSRFSKVRIPGDGARRDVPIFLEPETKADEAFTSYRFPQPTRVTSNLAPHFKFVHDCPNKGSKEQFFEN
jgi:hypothetical protein